MVEQMVAKKVGHQARPRAAWMAAALADAQVVHWTAYSEMLLATMLVVGRAVLKVSTTEFSLVVEKEYRSAVSMAATLGVKTVDWKVVQMAPELAVLMAAK